MLARSLTRSYFPLHVRPSRLIHLHLSDLYLAASTKSAKQMICCKGK